MSDEIQKNEVIEEFKKFLLEENCFTAFVWNLKHTIAGSWELEEHFQNRLLEDFKWLINDGFCGDKTKEGYKYWNKKSYKWQERFDEIIKGF